MEGNSEGEPRGLRADCLRFPEVLGQSVANVAPTATPTVNIPLVFASAGAGTWVAYLIATIGMVLVGLNINQFARRSASPGSLYTYVEKGLGPGVGVVTGWALALAYLLTAMATLAGFADYAGVLFKATGLTLPPAVLFAVCAWVCWYLSHKDVQISTASMLIMEFISVGLVLALCIMILSRRTLAVDLSQFALRGDSINGIRLGMVIAVLSFVGFESATSLGHEARNPLKTIPRAVITSTVVSGLFFIFCSYVVVLGFRDLPISMNKAEAPLTYLAEQLGIGFFGLLISVGAAISFFACTLACINAGARVAYSLAHPGILHPLLRHTHERNRTPDVAITVVALGAFLGAASLALFGSKPLDIYNTTGTLATYGFMLVYLLICVAAPAYLHREKALTAGDIGLAILSGLFMVVVIVGSVYPPPEAPARYLPYLFGMALVVGAVWWRLVDGNVRRPGSSV